MLRKAEGRLGSFSLGFRVYDSLGKVDPWNSSTPNATPSMNKFRVQGLGVGLQNFRLEGLPSASTFGIACRDHIPNQEGILRRLQACSSLNTLNTLPKKPETPSSRQVNSPAPLFACDYLVQLLHSQTCSACPTYLTVALKKIGFRVCGLELRR